MKDKKLVVDKIKKRISHSLFIDNRNRDLFVVDNFLRIHLRNDLAEVSFNGTVLGCIHSIREDKALYNELLDALEEGLTKQRERIIEDVL